MPEYNLALFGAVGEDNFTYEAVSSLLAENEGQQVDILIDSLGGRADVALSIAAAFKRHGKVRCHIVGMTASAATIATLGAERVTMNSNALYLAHKSGNEFLVWGVKNSDELAAIVADIEQQREDLDKLDQVVAQMYAARAGKDAAETLALMARGAWLTAQEALDWGLVDEVTEDADVVKPSLTAESVREMISAGIPLPSVPVESPAGTMSKFVAAVADLFHKSRQVSVPPALMAAAGMEGQAPEFSQAVADAVTQAVAEARERVAALEGETARMEGTIAERDAEIARLRAELDSRPAAATANVVTCTTTKETKSAAQSALERYTAAAKGAAEMLRNLK